MFADMLDTVCSFQPFCARREISVSDGMQEISRDNQPLPPLIQKLREFNESKMWQIRNLQEEAAFT